MCNYHSKPWYQLGWIKKGMALGLFWSFAALVVLNYAINDFVLGGNSSINGLQLLMVLPIILMLFPLAGWLADVCREIQNDQDLHASYAYWGYFFQHRINTQFCFKYVVGSCECN